MVPPSFYTTPWKAPPSPGPISPLNVRKGHGHGYSHSNDYDFDYDYSDQRHGRSMSISRYSPVSARDVSPSSLYSRDTSRRDSRFAPELCTIPSRQTTRSTRDSRYAPELYTGPSRETTRSGRSRSTKSSRSPLFINKAPVDLSVFSGLQVDDRSEKEKELERQKALPPLPPPPMPSAYRQTGRRHIAEEKRNDLYSPGTSPSLKPFPTQQYSGPFRTQYADMVSDPVDRPVLATRNTMHQTVKMTQSSRKRRRRFWILGVILVLLVAGGAAAGAVIVTQKRAATVKSEGSSGGSAAASAPPAVTPTAAPDIINAGLPSKDLQVDTPLVPIQFVANTSNNGQSQGSQNFEIWYQNKCGNSKGVRSDGAWNSYGTAFTDAKNVSGMAGFTFFNDSIKSFQTYLFYVGNDGNLRDKKLNPQTNVFELGSLSSMHLPVSPAPSSALSDTSRASDGLALTAAYSENFAQGAGARLLYHTSNATGNYIQELIWVQATDKWIIGAVLGPNISALSHMAMVADEANAVLRLMYVDDESSTSSVPIPPRLQEWYMLLTTNPANTNVSASIWHMGRRFDGMLQHASSTFALAAAGADAFLYHASVANDSSAALQIQEVTLPPANGTGSVVLRATDTVAIPDWLSRDTAARVPTVFTPIGAVGSRDAVTVFYADGVEDALAGYDNLVVVQRPLGKMWADAKPADVPLDAQCTSL